MMQVKNDKRVFRMSGSGFGQAIGFVALIALLIYFFAIPMLGSTLQMGGKLIDKKGMFIVCVMIVAFFGMLSYHILYNIWKKHNLQITVSDNCINLGELTIAWQDVLCVKKSGKDGNDPFDVAISVFGTGDRVIEIPQGIEDIESLVSIIDTRTTS